MGDSLGFVPYPWGGDQAEHSIRRLDATNEAVRHQRALVRNVASTWVAAFPDSPDAWQVLAMSLASLGERSALDTLARARALARTQADHLRVAGNDVAMQVAFALRDRDTVRLRRARTLADSLLADVTHHADAVLMSSLAALTGRATVAARFARAQPVADAFAVPAPLRDGVGPLLVLSALGGPADTLLALERHVGGLIAGGVSPGDRRNRRLEFLARGASMAFPLHRYEQLETLAKDGDALVILQERMLHGDSSAVRRGLRSVSEARRSLLPEHLALDALTPEAALLWMLGDAPGVVAWLEPTLAVLPQAQPGFLSSPVRAASLTHALVLRARAAEQLGDGAGARRWASAVEILWSHADSFLQPLVEEARRISRRS